MFHTKELSIRYTTIRCIVCTARNLYVYIVRSTHIQKIKKKIKLSNMKFPNLAQRRKDHSSLSLSAYYFVNCNKDCCIYSIFNENSSYMCSAIP